MSSKFHFEVFQSKRNDEWYWRFRASGRTIADGSEGYKNKADCLHGIDLVKENAPSADVVDVDD